VLRKLSDILRSNTRETDLIGRLGGDEFVMWLDDTDANVALKRGENLLAAARSLKNLSGSPDKPLAVSLGVAIYDPRSGETRDGLIARADAAMYEAKKGGKGRLAMAPNARPAKQRINER
jgi:diguanylate cyclase (GGDEF)-like protein